MKDEKLRPERLALVTVLLIAVACAGRTAAPTVAPLATAPASGTIAAPTSRSTTQPVLETVSPGPTLTPQMTLTGALMPTGTTGVTTGQVLSIYQTLGLTFIDSKQGWLLAAGPCLDNICPVTLRQTHDGGQTWLGLPAPTAAADFFPNYPQPAGAAAAVSAIRFATARDGWVFGPSLYATHDGGQTWHAEQRTVSSLAVTHGAVWAVEQQGRLPIVVRSTDAGQSWMPARMRPLLIGWPAITSVNAQTAWLFAQDSVLNPQLLVTNDGGNSWSELQMPLQPCQTAIVKPVTALFLWYICGGGPATDEQAKQIYTSSDGGVSWQLKAKNEPPVRPTGQIDSVGVLLRSANFAAPSSALAFMALSRGTLIVTRDGGHHWTDALPYARANGGSDPTLGPLEFVNAQDGWLAVSPNSLFRTTDSGHTWTETAVP